MNEYLQGFKQFYLNVVLPNINSYNIFFNENNFDKKIDILISNYKKSFGINPFEIIDYNLILKTIQENSKIKENDFRRYSDSVGSGVPAAIIFSHYTKYLTYFNKSIKFNSLQSFIDKIHIEINDIGNSDNFIKKFKEFRKDITGQVRIVKKDILFGDVREDFWSINLGAEKEIQYHIHILNNSIRYGLGFNIQASQNNHDPILNVKPYKESFYIHRNEIDAFLKNYIFFGEDENNLKNLVYGKFCLYGKEIPYTKTNNGKDFEMDGFNFLETIYNLKYKQFKAYKLIFEKSKIPNTKLILQKNIMDIKSLIEYKKQVILQGPPGTGKTRLAKEIARDLVLPKEITVDDIKNYISLGTTVYSKIDCIPYKVFAINNTSITLELQNQSKQTRNIDKIIKAYTNILNGQPLIGGDAYETAIAKYIIDNWDYNESLKLIQFHPSYTYEDFVRGIIAIPSEAGTGVLYKSENKILAKLAKTAFDNWQASENPIIASQESWLDNTFEVFLENLNEKLEGQDNRIMITSKAYITRIAAERESIRYNADAWEVDGGVPFSDIKKMYQHNVLNRNEIINQNNLTKTAKHLPTYWFKIYDLFKNYIEENKLKASKDVKIVTLKNYVIIIDEINRANLSSVLGELIYALEYRGEDVESMYAIAGNNKLTIPPNLFIIGTMNTADRSVGHIDYAIRRRFAFVDVLPKKLKDDKIVFHADLFKKVAGLFIKNYDSYVLDNNIPLENEKEYLSEEFNAKDVWLGHSYFIQKKIKDTATLEPENFNIRVKYEIVPILREYVKDGILNDKATEKINEIEKAYPI